MLKKGFNERATTVQRRGNQAGSQARCRGLRQWHPQHWMNISIGRSGFSLIAIASLWDSQSGSYDKHEVRAEFGLNDENAKNYFSQLEDEKESIENELGEQLTWHNPENKKASRVFLQETVDLNDRARWSEYHDWHVGKLEALKRVFAPRVKVLQVVDQE